MKKESTITPKQYELLGLMSRDALFGGQYDKGVNEDEPTDDITTAYIQTMYYSALSNLYAQSALPDEIKIMDGDMPPRLSLALDRSYIDFNSAKSWLSKNVSFINKSRSKLLYEEALELEKGMVINTKIFISAK